MTVSIRCRETPDDVLRIDGYNAASADPYHIYLQIETKAVYLSLDDAYTLVDALNLPPRESRSVVPTSKPPTKPTVAASSEELARMMGMIVALQNEVAELRELYAAPALTEPGKEPW